MARDERARQGSRVQTTFLEMHERARHARLITQWRHRDLSRRLQAVEAMHGCVGSSTYHQRLQGLPHTDQAAAWGLPTTANADANAEHPRRADTGCGSKRVRFSASRSDRVEAAANCSIPPRHDPIVWLTGTRRSQRDCGCACGPPNHFSKAFSKVWSAAFALVREMLQSALP